MSASSSAARLFFAEYLGQGNSYQNRPQAVWMPPFSNFESMAWARESRSLNFPSIPWRSAVKMPIPRA